MELPPECRAGLGAAPSGTLPVKAEQLDSLLDAFRRAPDPRDDHTRYRIGPVLTLIALALLAGRREIAEIARFATTLKPPQRRRLNLPLKQGTRFYQVPGYGVFYQVLTRMDPEAFATLLNRWLQSRAGRLPAALALDGKIITANPLRCQRAHARTIVEKGGEYLFQIKGNQPSLLQQAQGLDALKGTPFLPTAQAVTSACQPGGCTPSTSKPSAPTFPSRAP